MRTFCRSKLAVIKASEENKEREHVGRVTERAVQRYHDYRSIKAMVDQCIEHGKSGTSIMNIWHEGTEHGQQRVIWRYGQAEYEPRRGTALFGDHLKAVIYGDEVYFILV